MRCIVFELAGRGTMSPVRAKVAQTPAVRGLSVTRRAISSVNTQRSRQSQQVPTAGALLAAPCRRPIVRGERPGRTSTWPLPLVTRKIESKQRATIADLGEKQRGHNARCAVGVSQHLRHHLLKLSFSAAWEFSPFGRLVDQLLDCTHGGRKRRMDRIQGAAF